MDEKPKRKYTVSGKVLAACRRNLEKANAVPNSIRYRPTPRRLAASRANLLIAHARRTAQAPSPKPHPKSPPANRLLRAALCRWGQGAKEQFRARFKDQLAAADACQEKAARAIAACATRWLTLLGRRLQREQKTLLRLLDLAPQSDASRLAGLFTSPDQIEPSFARLELRIKRLGRMLFELRCFPSLPLRAALEEIPVQALGNPLRPMPPSAMAALLQLPAPALPTAENADGSGQGAEALLAEAPWSVEEQLHFSEPRISNPDPRTPNPESRTPRAFPADFAEFQTLVKDALISRKIPGARLDAAVERIARLIWDRYELAAREWKRAQEAIQSAFSGPSGPSRLPGAADFHPQRTESALDDSAPPALHADLAQRVLEALTGEAAQRTRIQAIEFERQLLEAIGRYLDLCHSSSPPPQPKPAGTWKDWEKLLNLR